jgi:uncharacterized protein (DUF1501 family)
MTTVSTTITSDIDLSAEVIKAKRLLIDSISAQIEDLLRQREALVGPSNVKKVRKDRVRVNNEQTHAEAVKAALKGNKSGVVIKSLLADITATGHVISRAALSQTITSLFEAAEISRERSGGTDEHPRYNYSLLRTKK